MKIAYIGFGSFGKHVQSFIHEKYGEKIRQEVFFDSTCNGHSFFPFEAFDSDEFKEFSFYICLGYKQFKAKSEILQKLNSLNRNAPNLIHNTSYIHTTAKIDQGVIVFPNCTVDMNAQLASGVILHNNVVVSHDTFINSGSYVSPGVVLSGNVTIGKNCFLGARTTVANNISIGSNSVVGIGSVIVNNLENETNGIGNPFRVLDKQLNIA